MTLQNEHGNCIGLLKFAYLNRKGLAQRASSYLAQWHYGRPTWVCMQPDPPVLYAPGKILFWGSFSRPSQSLHILQVRHSRTSSRSISYWSELDGFNRVCLHILQTAQMVLPFFYYLLEKTNLQIFPDILISYLIPTCFPITNSF